jgi:hypothetical protein
LQVSALSFQDETDLQQAVGNWLDQSMWKDFEEIARIQEITYVLWNEVTGKQAIMIYEMTTFGYFR